MELDVRRNNHDATTRRDLSPRFDRVFDPEAQTRRELTVERRLVVSVTASCLYPARAAALRCPRKGSALDFGPHQPY